MKQASWHIWMLMLNKRKESVTIYVKAKTKADAVFQAKVWKGYKLSKVQQMD